MTTECVLLADVGGTNARFAIAERLTASPDIRPILKDFWKTPGDAYGSFTEAALAYLRKTDARPDRAVFAVAGPVIGNQVHFTNRDWSISAKAVSASLHIEHVELINDFVAMSRSVPLLNDMEQTPIRAGAAEPKSNYVVAGPGTGFGLAAVAPLGNDFLVMGGEGGHQAFSPQDAYEIELLKALQIKHGYVSIENVAAGMAFESVLEVTFEIFGKTAETLTPAEVLDRANAGDEMCRTFCQMRANVAMSAIGDAVLATNARGGAWLAGGVSARIKDFLLTEEAEQRFSQRGPKTELMADIPVNLITSDEAALIGAAAYRRIG